MVASLGNGAGGGVGDGGLGNGGGGGWCESERNEARESGSSVCFPLSDFSCELALVRAV